MVGSRVLQQLPYTDHLHVDGPLGRFLQLFRRLDYNQVHLSALIPNQNVWQCTTKRRRSEGCRVCIHRLASEEQTKPKNRLSLGYPQKAAFSSATWHCDLIRRLLLLTDSGWPWRHQPSWVSFGLLWSCSWLLVFDDGKIEQSKQWWWIGFWFTRLNISQCSWLKCSASVWASYVYVKMSNHIHEKKFACKKRSFTLTFLGFLLFETCHVQTFAQRKRSHIKENPSDCTFETFVPDKKTLYVHKAT